MFSAAPEPLGILSCFGLLGTLVKNLTKRWQAYLPNLNSGEGILLAN